MSRPVSLAVHKSQKQRRRAKEIRDNLLCAISDAQEEFGIDFTGYALISWGSDGKTLSFWNGIEPLGACPLDVFVNRALQRAMGIRDARHALNESGD